MEGVWSDVKLGLAVKHQTDVWLKIIFIELEHKSFIYMKVYNVDTLGSAQVITDWVIYLNLFKLELIYLNKFIN